MLEFQLKLTASQQHSLNARLKLAQQLGNVQRVKRILAIQSLGAGTTIATVAANLKIAGETVRLWLQGFLLKGVSSLQEKQSPGRPAKLTQTQLRELATLIDAGPAAAGYSAGCWRSPLIQHLISEKFGVHYSVHYIAQLLQSLGFSFQKARFVSDHLDPQARKNWLAKHWPAILRLARRRNACVLFGDEASFPQWGTLSYTWARRGVQPVVQTSGTRKAYKVFGLVDYFTGKFYYQAIEGRLCSQSYQQFLKQVLSQIHTQIILIQDGATYHTAKATRQFFAHHSDRITVFDLPAYSPDFNPIEMLWKKIKVNHIHLHYFPTFEDLRAKVDLALFDFQLSPKEVLPLFGFYDKLAA